MANVAPNAGAAWKTMETAMRSLLGNIRLTFAIAAMAVCSIAIAIGAVLLGLFISLSNTAQRDAAHEVASATRITAEILQVNLPSLEIASDETGNVATLQCAPCRAFAAMM